MVITCEPFLKSTWRLPDAKVRGEDKDVQRQTGTLGSQEADLAE
jgi:hypothetical protein